MEQIADAAAYPRSSEQEKTAPGALWGLLERFLEVGSGVCPVLRSGGQTGALLALALAAENCVANCDTLCYTDDEGGGSVIFEWDDEKEKINIAKHGIDFATAARVFADENRIEFFDAAHSDEEDRYITIGMIGNVAYIVMVVFTDRDEAIRLISARKATKQERRMYHDYSQGN